MKTSSWLDFKTSVYATHFDTVGTEATFRDILFTRCIEYLPTILKLRTTSNKELKKSLPAFSLNLLDKRTSVINYSGLMQLDIDRVQDYDIDSLKKALFDLDFVCLASLS